MKRKTLGFLALSITAFMVLQTPATVSAETIYVAETDGDNDSGEKHMEHNGDITSTSSDSDNNVDWPAAAASGDGYSLSVTGNVTSTNNAPAVAADSGGSVSVSGDASAVDAPAVTADGNGSTANVDGDASAQDAPAIVATNCGTVSVGGDVTNNSPNAGVDSNGDPIFGDPTIIANTGGSVSVGGDVTSKQNGPAIDVDNTSSVVVEGDAASGNTAICIELDNASGSGEVVVLGTVSAGGEGNSIWIEVGSNLNGRDAIINALPTIIVGKLEAQNGDYYLWNSYDQTLVDTNADDPDIGVVNDAIFEKIQYHINVQNPSNGSVDVSGASTYGNYLVANEGTALSVTITVDDGYELSSVSGGSAQVIRNADGTYQIIVPRGGGVDISAIIKALAQASAEVKEESAPTQVRDLRYANFQKVIQSLVAQIPQNGTLNLDMGDWISFDKKTFETFSKRPDMAIVITYTYMGHKYRVTIPAGYPIMDLLNEEGYCGCLYLNAVFGSELLD